MVYVEAESLQLMPFLLFVSTISVFFQFPFGMAAHTIKGNLQLERVFYRRVLLAVVVVQTLREITGEAVGLVPVLFTGDSAVSIEEGIVGIGVEQGLLVVISLLA